MSKRSDGWRGNIRFEKEIDMANQKELKKGVKVRFIDESMHRTNRMFYPVVGTVGVINKVCDDDGAWVDWGDDGVKCHGVWHSPSSALEIVKSRPPKILITVDKDDTQKVIAKDLDSGKTGVAKCNPTDTFDFMTGAKLAIARLCGEEALKPKCKFKVGDKIVGNEKANRYEITRQGWKGVVTEVLKEPIKNMGGADDGKYWIFKAHSVSTDMNFYLVDDAFDLLPEPKGWNGKVVCVDTFRGSDLTAGKVYAVKDGVLRNDIGHSVISDIIIGPDDFKRKDLFSTKFIEYKGEA
jgi:hypothetical protein